MNTTQTPEFKKGDLIEHIDPTRRGHWLVTKVEGNTLTVTNPHTHSGRTWVPAYNYKHIGA